MLNKKDNLIIFVLCLIVISLGVLIMLKNQTDIRIAKNTNINLNQNQNVNKIVNNNANQNQNINQNINANTNQQIATTTNEIDTSDWNIYMNKKYGFSFKYPRGWYCGGVALDKNSQEQLFCMPAKNEKKDITKVKSKKVIKEYILLLL